jgi:hypothetical protein
VERFYPKVAARIQGGLEAEEQASAKAQGLRQDAARADWSEAQIMAELKPPERRRVQTELKLAQEAWAARIRNDCAHVPLVIRLRYVRAWAARRKILEELEAFLDSGRRKNDSLVRCRRCRQPAVCPHVLAAFEAKAQSGFSSEQSILNSLSRFIDQGRSGPKGSYGLVHYCRVCGEALGEFAAVETNLDVELALEGERADSGSAVVLLRQEGLRLHHRLAFPFEVDPAAYADRLAEDVRGAMISVMISRGVQADDPLQPVYAAAAAVAYAFSQATARPPPAGAPTAFKGVAAKNAVGFAAAMLRELSERFRGTGTGDESSVTPEFVKRLVLEIRDLAASNAATSTFARPKRVERFLYDMRERSAVYAAARNARAAATKWRPAPPPNPKRRVTPKAVAAQIDKELAAVLGRGVDQFVRLARSKKKTQVFEGLWAGLKPPKRKGKIPPHTTLYEEGYSAMVRHVKSGDPAYTREMAANSAAAWPHVFGPWRAKWEPSGVANTPPSVPPQFRRELFGEGSYPISLVYDAKGRPHVFDLAVYSTGGGKSKAPRLIELPTKTAVKDAAARGGAEFVGVKSSASGLTMLRGNPVVVLGEPPVAEVAVALATIRRIATVFDTFRVRCPKGQFHSEGERCAKCGYASKWGGLSRTIRAEGLDAAPTAARAWAEEAAAGSRSKELADRGPSSTARRTRSPPEPSPKGPDTADGGPVETSSIPKLAEALKGFLGKLPDEKASLVEQLERLGGEALTPFGKRASEDREAAEEAKTSEAAETTAARAAWRHCVGLATNLSIARNIRKLVRSSVPVLVWDAVAEAEGVLPPEKELKEVPSWNLLEEKKKIEARPPSDRRLAAVVSMCELGLRAATSGKVGAKVAAASIREILEEVRTINSDTNTLTTFGLGAEAGEFDHGGADVTETASEGPEMGDEDVSFSYEEIDYDGANEDGDAD